jgi:glyoxylase-like metal-dependent hydrolase (beta-lactamase superfamily II)
VIEELAMDAIHIPESDIVEIDNVAPGVHGLRILFVNVFAVKDTDGWVLIDAGLFMSDGRIKRWAEKHFGDGTKPQAIILTHGHFDHTGALEALVKEWDVPVFAHKAELPHITGKAKYPPPDPSVGGGLMAWMSPLYSRGPANVPDNAVELPDDGKVPHLPSWTLIHTPGHTDGHVSFYRESDGVLLVGDAFCTAKQESFLNVATQKPEMSGPPAYYTTDWEAARDSVQKLAALDAQIIAPGHGQPVAGGDAAEKLKQLAQRFDELAKPDRGRYVA